MRYRNLMLLTLALISAIPAFVDAEAKPTPTVETVTKAAPLLQYRVVLVSENDVVTVMTDDQTTEPQKPIMLPSRLSELVQCALVSEETSAAVICMPRKAGVQIMSIAQNALSIASAFPETPPQQWIIFAKVAEAKMMPKAAELPDKPKTSKTKH